MVRRAAALPHQFDPPAGAADTVMGKRRRRRGGETPAGRRRGRDEERIGVGLLPMAEQQSRRPALLGGKLETAAGRHFGAPHFADHGGEAAMAHPLLHHRQHFFVSATFGIEQAIRLQANLRQGRREQVAAGECPEHLPPAPGEASGGGGEEQGRGGIVIRTGRGRRRLMQRHCQPAAGEPVIHRHDAKRGARLPSGGSAGALEGADLAAQGVKAWIGGSGHVTRTHMFALCSAFIHSESSQGRGGALDITPPLAQKAA